MPPMGVEEQSNLIIENVQAMAGRVRSLQACLKKADDELDAIRNDNKIVKKIKVEKDEVIQSLMVELEEAEKGRDEMIELLADHIHTLENIKSEISRMEEASKKSFNK